MALARPGNGYFGDADSSLAGYAVTAPVAGPGPRAVGLREPLHFGHRVEQPFASVSDTVEMRAVGRPVVEDRASRLQQALVAVQPDRPGAQLLPPHAELAGAFTNGPVAQPVPVHVPQVVAHAIAHFDVRAVLTDELLELRARLGGESLPGGEGGDALDQRAVAVEVEAMQAFALRPAEVSPPVAPQPAIRRLRKVHGGGLARGGRFGRGADRAGLSAGILPRLLGRPVGTGGGLDGGYVLPHVLGWPIRVPAGHLVLRFRVPARRLALPRGFLPCRVGRPRRDGA